VADAAGQVFDVVGRVVGRVGAAGVFEVDEAAGVAVPEDVGGVEVGDAERREVWLRWLVGVEPVQGCVGGSGDEFGVVGFGEPFSYGVGGVGRRAVDAFADPCGQGGVEWDGVEVSERLAEGGGLGGVSGALPSGSPGRRCMTTIG
jgi:hypothetical protein